MTHHGECLLIISKTPSEETNKNNTFKNDTPLKQSRFILKSAENSVVNRFMTGFLIKRIQPFHSGSSH